MLGFLPPYMIYYFSLLALPHALMGPWWGYIYQIMEISYRRLSPHPELPPSDGRSTATGVARGGIDHHKPEGTEAQCKSTAERIVYRTSCVAAVGRSHEGENQDTFF
jgi:hypothetical protein